MSDPLSELTLCEDGATSMPLTERTVVFKGVWGQNSYASKIEPMLGELATKVLEVGLRDEGIAVLFANRKDASLARLFFPGDTVTG